MWFESKVKRQGLVKTAVQTNDHILRCLVIPHSESRKAVGLILERSASFFTHRVQLPDGSETNGRLMVKVRGVNDLVDPFDFKFGE